MTRLAYVTTYDARPDASPTALLGVQGAGRSIASELVSRGVEVDFVGPLVSKVTLRTRAWRCLEKRARGTDWPAWLCRSFRRGLAREIERVLARERYDAVFSPQNFWPFSYLNFAGPMVVWTDAPFALQLGAIGNLRPSVRQFAVSEERAAFLRCSKVVVASQWAKSETEKLFGFDDGRVLEINWGGNAGGVDQDTHALLLQRRQASLDWHLLFVGIDWERKGLKVAMALAEALNEIRPTVLHVVGPSRAELPFEVPEYVRLHGRLSPSQESERTKLRTLYADCQVFMLPSHWENFGQVLCEANSYGLPCLGSTAGGIPSIIKEGVNGYCLDVAVPTERWVERFLQIQSDYQQMSHNAYREYQERLSWRAAVGRLCEELDWGGSRLRL